eukprot:578392-Hanusia_phi.AAC.2
MHLAQHADLADVAPHGHLVDPLGPAQAVDVRPHSDLHVQQPPLHHAVPVDLAERTDPRVPPAPAGAHERECSPDLVLLEALQLAVGELEDAQGDGAALDLPAQRLEVPSPHLGFLLVSLLPSRPRRLRLGHGFEDALHPQRLSHRRRSLQPRLGCQQGLGAAAGSDLDRDEEVVGLAVDPDGLDGPDYVRAALWSLILPPGLRVEVQVLLHQLADRRPGLPRMHWGAGISGARLRATSDPWRLHAVPEVQPPQLCAVGVAPLPVDVQPVGDLRPQPVLVARLHSSQLVDDHPHLLALHKDASDHGIPDHALVVQRRRRALVPEAVSMLNRRSLRLRSAIPPTLRPSALRLRLRGVCGSPLCRRLLPRSLRP